MSQTETKWAKGFYQNLKNVNGKNVVETKVKVQEFISFLLENQDAKGEVWISAWPKKEDDGKGTMVPIVNDWRPAPKQDAAQDQVPQAQVIEEEGDGLPF